jgi:hypothetical protein
MNGIHPTVRYLIACEEIIADPANPARISLVALINTIHSYLEPPFPFQFPELCVFVQLTECRGPADCHVEIVQADSGDVLFRTQTRRVDFPTDPLDVVGLSFRIRHLSFPEPGLYWIQFWYNESSIAQEAILLR